MSNWFIAFPIPARYGYPDLPPPPAGTRLVAAADLHLTIAFLGGIEEPRARAAFAESSRAATPPVAIVLGAVVPMGNPRRPSALAARVEAAGPERRSFSHRLAASRDAILAAAKLPREERAMKPHVTLARLRRRATSEERRRALAWATKCDLTSVRFELDRVALYTTARDPRTRVYDIIETCIIARS